MSQHVYSYTEQREPQKVGKVIESMFTPYRGSIIMKRSDNEYVLHGITYPTMQAAKDAYPGHIQDLINTIK